MSINKERGDEAESIAVKYLEKKGYIILNRNWRYQYAEVDIIAKMKQEIVFVEVKMRSNNFYGNPESFIDNKKINMLAHAADGYRNKYNYNGELRFDIISILKNNTIEEILHFEDAFYPR